MKKLSMFALLFLTAFIITACEGDTEPDPDPDPDPTLVFEVTSGDITLDEGETHQIEFEVDGVEIGFESSNEAIITVDDNGLITAVSSGQAGVLVSPDNGDFDTVEITVTVNKVIEITVDTTTIELIEGETSSISYEANTFVTFVSDDSNIVTVDDSGALTAVSEGSTTIRVIADEDESVYQTIDITVHRLIEINGPDEISLWVDADVTLDIQSTDPVSFSVEDFSIARVIDGVVTGREVGTTTITVQSSADPSITHTITVHVYNATEMIQVDGPSEVNLGQEAQYAISFGPEAAYPYVSFSVSDDSVATIDEDGVLTPLTQGVITITATSLFDGSDDVITDSIEVEIVHYVAVDANAETLDTWNHEGMDFVFGQTMFNSLYDALASSQEGVTIYINDGDLTGTTISLSQATIQGVGDHSLSGVLLLDADDITLKNLTFDAGEVMVDGPVKNVSLLNNTFTNASEAAIRLDVVTNLTIDGNYLEGSAAQGIMLLYIEGEIEVLSNTIIGFDEAIRIKTGETLSQATNIEMAWNTIDDVDQAFYLDIHEDVIGFARYNTVTNVASIYVGAYPGELEFTLNYWDGQENLDMNQFENVSETMLQGHYTNISDVVSRSQYHPDVPGEIIITNPITNMTIGDDPHAIDLAFLPLSEAFTRVQFITSDPDVLAINQDGVMTAVGSGPVTITVRSRLDHTINATMQVEVTTTPGIEITPNEVMNVLTVGDLFSMSTMVFPYDIAGADVMFESSDETIALVDYDGNVETVGAGVVTFTARLVDQPEVYNKYTVEIYDELDENDLLDLLTMYSVSYSTPHRWTAYGFNFNYEDFRYESVSRYYFSDPIENTERIVPVSSGVRPGAKMDPHPDGIEAFNPENVYWVVIHDTANTAPGAGALSHSNYLYNAAVNGDQLWVSWHYTIDDTLLYQHLPEDERGFHAGDGSSRPGTSSTYLGGGNRNGIGIEMSPNIDGDMWRTWQRTAKLSADILYRYNLPLDHLRYHIDFSGKVCPQTLIRAGLVPTFEEMAEIEYIVRSEYQDATITFESHNPDYIDEYGRVIAMPERAMTASYTITVVEDGVERSRTFSVYLPGTVH